MISFFCKLVVKHYQNSSNGNYETLKNKKLIAPFPGPPKNYEVSHVSIRNLKANLKKYLIL